MSKVVATPNRQLSAALLKLDKTAYKHVASDDNSSEFLKITLEKGNRANGLPGHVMCVSGSNEKTQRSFYTHAADLLDEFVVFRMAFIRYGEGEMRHNVFDRALYTDAPDEFFVAVSRLDGEFIVMQHGENWAKDRTFVRSSSFADWYGKDAKKRLEVVRAKLTALQNSLKHGNGGVVYDERATVRAGKLTAYGQYVIDNGKRQDAALKDWRASHGYEAATQPSDAGDYNVAMLESQATATS